jgi:hypothetical protein
MARDRIVEEVRAIRARIAKAHGYDIKALVRTFQREGERTGRTLVRLPPRRVAKKSGKRKTG